MQNTFVEKNMRHCIVWFVGLFLFCVIQPCYAECRPFSVLFKDVPFLEEVELGGGMTYVYQFAHNANGDTLSQVGDNVDDSTYSIDLALGKAISDFGKVYIRTEYSGGEGVEDELKVYSSVNNDANKNGVLRLAEAWYEHYLSDYSFTITAGKIDATQYIDTNMYANCEMTQFLARMFVNSPTIEFGDNAVGARIGWLPNDTIELELVGMDANSDVEHLFSEKFFAGQLTIKPQLFQRNGHIRLLGWLNNRDHTTWLDVDQTNEEGFGFGMSIDQELTDALGVFFRYGWQDPEAYFNVSSFSLEHAASAGMHLKGVPWGREHDVLGLGYGLIFPSGDYQESQVVAAKSEGHLEMYYNVYVNKFFSVSPDVQAVWRPYGRDAANGSEVIIVYGARGQISF